MNEKYEINEKDIESVIRWLKINDPQNANREKAVAMLQDMKAGFHGMAHHDPEKLLELQQQLNQPKPDKP